MSNESTANTNAPDKPTLDVGTGAPASSESKPPRTRGPRPPSPPSSTEPTEASSSIKEDARTDEERRRDAALEAKRKKREEDAKEARAKFDASLQEYLYIGPQGSVTHASGVEIQLHPGELVKLPPDDKYTKRLVSRRYVTTDNEQLEAARERQAARASAEKAEA